MPKRTKSSGNKAVTALMLLAACGVGAFAMYVKLNPAAHRVPDDLRQAPVETAPAEGDPEPSHRIRRRGPEVSVTTKNEEPGGLRIPSVNGLDVKLGDPAPPAPDNIDPKAFLATQTFAAVKIDGAKALGVSIKGRNAILDCSPELEQGMGTNQEGSLVKAMAMALGQFPDIDTFQFSVDGHTLDSLGALDLSDPIPVTRPDGQDVKPAEGTPPPATP